MFRKIIAGIMIAGFLGAGIASCATNGTGAVSLASAQAEAKAILTGIEQAATAYEVSPQANPLIVKELQAAIAGATTAVDAFTGVASGANATQIAQAVTQAVGAAVMVIPMDPATKTAIDLGLAVLDAFIGGISPPAGVPAAAPTPVTSELFGERHVEPPVPIPAPRFVPAQ
jgi:hypothetical protein